MIRTLALTAALLACAGAQAVTTTLSLNTNPMGEIVVSTDDDMGTPSVSQSPSCAIDAEGEDFPCAQALYFPNVDLADSLSITSEFETFKQVSWAQFDLQISPSVRLGDMPDFSVTFTAVDMDTSAVLFTVTHLTPFVVQTGGQYLYRSPFFTDIDDVRHMSMTTTITPLEPLDPGEMPMTTIYAVTVATIPEPGTYALMLLGLAAVGLRRRAHG